MTPIELLTQELVKYKKALEKSEVAHTNGQIDICIHEMHKRNLTPKIEEYENVINFLIDHHGEY